MDAIQKVLIEAGRKDLAREYYKKISTGSNDDTDTHKKLLKAISKKMDYIFVVDKHSTDDKFILGVMSSNLLNVVKETMKDKKVAFDDSPKNIYISVE